MTFITLLRAIASFFGFATGATALIRDRELKQAGADAQTLQTEATIARITDEQAQNNARPRSAADIAQRLRDERGRYRRQD
jgi:hypothetical protein